MTRWVTFERASDLTGLPVTYFHERTGSSGKWPEGRLWKWFEGRNMIDSQALDEFIEARPSSPSQRGRRKSAEYTCQA